MFTLPFPDNSFDVATSFNGIWKGCEGALEEARRVLVPEGHFGVTFWGRFERLDLMPYFLATKSSATPWPKSSPLCTRMDWEFGSRPSSVG